jgi:hypothetical protein
MEYKESYAAKRKKNLEKRACLDNYNTYLYHSEVYKINMDILSLILKKNPSFQKYKNIFLFSYIWLDSKIYMHVFI